MGQPFQTIQLAANPTAQDINRIQGNVSSAFNALSSPFIGGNLLTKIALTTTPTAVNHKLNRKPQLWVICDQQNGASVWRTDWDENSITLQASSACTISLWVN